MKQLLAIVFVTMFSVFSFAQTKEALGKECIHQLFEEENYKKVHAMFSDDFKTKLTEAKLSQTGAAFEALGDYQGIIEVNKDENGNYYYYVRFEKQSMDVIISFDNNNKIKGLMISSEHKEFKKKK
ncbi:MAG: DUF3887 domain-containing protein [Cruoricaptor ignavus]|nr:DUF3887 domain-containing protein [Cruoricaptor ignavus]